MFSSDKMYKSRLKAWNMEKNLRREEVLAMMRVKMQRDFSGQKAEFWRNGKMVSYETLHNYLRFNKKASADLRRYIDSDRKSMLPIEAILPAHIVVLNPMPPLKFDERMHNTEGMLVGFQNYTQAAFSNGTWQQARSGNWFSMKGGTFHGTLDFRSYVYVAIRMVNEGHVHRAQFLNIAFSAIKPIIMTENPSLVIEITVLFHELENEFKRPEIGRLFIDYVARVSHQCFGAKHPLTNWFMGLKRLEGNKAEIYEVLIRSYEDLVRSRTQGHNQNITHAMIHYSKVADGIDPEFYKKEQHKLLTDIDVLGRAGPRAVNTIIGLRRYQIKRLIDREKYQEGLDLIEEIVRGNSEEANVVHLYMGHIYASQGRMEESEREFAIEAGLADGFDSDTELEAYHVIEISMLWRIIDALRKWGLYPAAEKLRQRRDQILDRAVGKLRVEDLFDVKEDAV